MANNNLNVGATFTIDASQLHRELNRISLEMSAAQKEFSNSVASLKHWGDSIKGASERQKLLTNQLRLQEDAVKAYSAYVSQLSKRMTENGNATKSQRRELERAMKDLDSATAKYQRFQRQLWEAEDRMSELKEEEVRNNSELGRLTKTMREQEAVLNSLVMDYQNAYTVYGRFSTQAVSARKAMERANDELLETRRRVEALGNFDIRNRQQISLMDILGVGSAAQIVGGTIQDAFSAAKRAIHEIGEEFVAFESAFAGVKRTVEGSEADFVLLRNQIMELGTSLATPVDEIADIAAIAGQMGIGVNQISEFTRVMIQLGDTTNVSAEEAGQSLAQLSNLLGLMTDEYEKMGSAIVQLGNEYPTTEQDIIDMSSRLAGMAGQVSMSAADVLGLANALAAVGLEAEMGGNTISKTLREMLMAVENNTEALVVFANTADMSVSDFARLFKDDATAALSAFIEGLNDVDRNGRSATQILRELGITETRQIDTLLRLAGNSTLLAESIDSSNRAWDENVALAREAAERYKTTESRLEMMRNSWRNVAIEIGDFFSPAVDKGIDLLTDFADLLRGSDAASFDLDRELDNLIATIDDYRRAQDEAAESTDITTQMMRHQANIAQIIAGKELAKSTNDSFKTINSSLDNMSVQRSEMDQAMLRFQIFLNDPKRNTLGFENIDDILSWLSEYEMNATAFEKANNKMYQELLGTYNMWTESNSDLHQAVLDMSDDIENVTDTAMNVADYVRNGDLTMMELSGYLSDLTDKNRETMTALITNLAESEEDGISKIDFYLETYGKNEENINRLLENIRSNISDYESVGNLDSYVYAMNLNQERYLEDLLSTITKANSAMADFESSTDSIKKVSDEVSKFTDELAATRQYNLTMGISGEDAASEEMSIYQRTIRSLIDDQMEYNKELAITDLNLDKANKLIEEYDGYASSLSGDELAKARDAMLGRFGLGGKMTNEVFREYLEQYAAAVTEGERITEEYFANYGDIIRSGENGIKSDFSEIVASYNESMKAMMDNRQKFGDDYDFNSNRANLLDSTLDMLLNVPLEERTQEYYDFVDAIKSALSLYDKDNGEDPLENMAKRLNTVETMFNNLANVDPSQLDRYKSTLRSQLESLYADSFAIDFNSLDKVQQDNVIKGREFIVNTLEQIKEEDRNSMLEDYAGITNMFNNLATVPEDRLESVTKGLKSRITSLYNKLLTLDPEVADSIIVDENGTTLKEAIEKLMELLGVEIEDIKDSSNWWGRFKDSSRSSAISMFGWDESEYDDITSGISDMLSDVKSLWDQIGGGILDTINQWYDAQISAVEYMEEKLEEELERYQKTVESGEKIRENSLRKQLNEGEISEEEYYRKSAKNKLDSEAEKRKAEEETEQKREELARKREELERKQFEADKVNSIADILISGAQAIAAAWGVNPIYGAVMSAIIGAMTAAQIGVVSSQRYTPALAKGGIVSSPTTALIGEDGPEAVIPLVNNTEWIQELAEKLNTIMSSDMAVRTVERNTVREGQRTESISNSQSFTQIINSPKALSRKEIYRDTRRLLRTVRRANDAV